MRDIPATAHDAYRRAERILAQVAPKCELPWTLVAGIGLVESNHGRYGGAVLGPDGVSTPHIIGVPLTGAGAVARVLDTDNGRYDGDTRWDRAMGPMQLIPSTWSLVGVDGDADGVRSPNDIDDAALAAGVYLCAGGSRGIDEPSNTRKVIFRYNQSSSYASLVMSYERAYRERGVAATVATSALLTDRGTAAEVGAVLHAKVDVTDPATTSRHRQRHDQQSAPDRGDPPSTKRPRVRHTSSPPDESVPEPAPVPDAEGNPEPHPTPDPSLEVTPEPEPATEPMPDFEPAPAPSNDPDPSESTLESGTWQECSSGYCLGEIPLTLDLAYLSDQTPTNIDGDGVIREYAAELAGLVGREVLVRVVKRPTGWTVVEPPAPLTY